MPQIFKKSPIFRKNKLKNGKNFLKTKNSKQAEPANS